MGSLVDKIGRVTGAELELEHQQDKLVSPETKTWFQGERNKRVIGGLTIF